MFNIELYELFYYIPTYYNNYVYTVESVASTIADKEGGIEPPIFIITRMYTNRIIIAITIFIIFILYYLYLNACCVYSFCTIPINKLFKLRTSNSFLYLFESIKNITFFFICHINPFFSLLIYSLEVKFL